MGKVARYDREEVFRLFDGGKTAVEAAKIIGCSPRYARELLSTWQTRQNPDWQKAKAEAVQSEGTTPIQVEMIPPGKSEEEPQKESPKEAPLTAEALVNILDAACGVLSTVAVVANGVPMEKAERIVQLGNLSATQRSTLLTLAPYAVRKLEGLPNLPDLLAYGFAIAAAGFGLGNLIRVWNEAKKNVAPTSDNRAPDGSAAIGQVNASSATSGGIT